MKKIKKDILFWILIILPFIITACFMPLLPDKIPSHLWDLEAEWESKYTVFYTNIIIAVMEIVYYFGYIWKANKKVENSVHEREQAVFKNSESHNRVLLLVMFLIFTLLNFLYLLLTYLVVNNHDMNVAGIFSVFVSSCLGICLIVMGNVMPRMYEYKDPFSKKWKNTRPQILRKVNHFSGICFMLCGVVIVILAFIIHNILSLIVGLVLTLITAIVVTIYSYTILAREEKKAKS